MQKGDNRIYPLFITRAAQAEIFVIPMKRISFSIVYKYKSQKISLSSWMRQEDALLSLAEVR